MSDTAFGKVAADAAGVAPAVTYGAPKFAKMALAAVDSGGGVFSFQNPEAGAIVIIGLVVDVTTRTNAACTLSAGTTAVNGTTLSANLIDGLDIRTAAGMFNNFDNHGTLGKSNQRLAASAWVTGSVASGASAGLVGNVYMVYVVL